MYILSGSFCTIQYNVVSGVKNGFENAEHLFVVLSIVKNLSSGEESHRMIFRHTRLSENHLCILP